MATRNAPAAAPQPRILLVEDEENLSRPLKFNLEQEGYHVEATPSGKEALELLARGPFDLVILDLMIEELDGLEVARRARRRDPKLPILMLTARSTPGDRVQGLETGADDNMVKPFHLRELLLRIHRMLERANWYASPAERRREASVGRYRVDLETLRGRGPHGELELTALEADLLRVLSAEPNRVHSRSELLQRVWGYHSDVESRTVDNFIVRLRRYFEEDPEQPRHFVSVRGRGYMFVP